MSKKYLVFIFLTACGPHGGTTQTLWSPSTAGNPTEETELLVTGLNDSQTLKKEARKAGIKVEGDAVLRLKGSRSQLRALSIDVRERPAVIENETILLSPPSTARAHPKPLYLAKKEFGLLRYWKKHPHHDGRGVIAGVIDDGVSPLGNGFRRTPDGRRKFIAKRSTSELLTLTLAKKIKNPPTLSPALKATQPLFGRIDENRLDQVLSLGPNSKPVKDLNGDKKDTEIDVVVFKQNKAFRVCVDTNVDKKIAAAECFGTFEATGELGFWTPDKLNAITAEYEAPVLRLTQGERGKRDSHGEGVASVLLGHRIGGKFDGVAPGAQLIDYDFTAPSGNSDAAHYTIGRFVRALEWLGKKGANVANISYSFYFVSAQAQVFMKKALGEIINKYNMVVSFSAGNFGPGLGSLGRRGLYPEEVLVAGAFVSRELDEHVHGVTGLPKQGRVVWYSSRGPGPQFGRGPVVISPLASIAHSKPDEGFGAFSGTSSASPALAGLAAVLISAVRAQRLPFDASAIVHAIRMSARPLSKVPFVDQGYGMPNIQRALRIYPLLARGKKFAYVTAKWGTKKGADGLDAAGLLLKTSNFRARDYRFAIKGELGLKVPKKIRANLLQTVDLHYSAPWISGPKRLWLASRAAGLYIRVSRPAKIPAAGELNGEVHILDSDTGLRIHTIPITIIDDRPLTKAVAGTTQLQAEEGKRFHFRALRDTQGIMIQTQALKGSGPNLLYQIYDSSSRPHVFGRVIDRPRIYSIKRAGWHQLALARAGGTASEVEVRTRLVPIKLELRNRLVSVAHPSVTVINHGAPVEGKLVLPEEENIVYRGNHVVADGNSAIRFGFDLEKEGRYQIKLETAREADHQFFVAYCLVAFKDAKNILLAKIRARDFQINSGKVRSFNAKKEEKPIFQAEATRAEVSCKPFAVISDQKAFEAGFRARVIHNSLDEDPRIQMPVHLKTGKNTIDLKWLRMPVRMGGSKLELHSLFGRGKVDIGELEWF